MPRQFPQPPLRQPYETVSAPSGVKADLIQSERDLALWLHGFIELTESQEFTQEQIMAITNRIVSLPQEARGNLGVEVMAAFINHDPTKSKFDVVAAAVKKHLEANAGFGHHHNLFHDHPPGFRNPGKLEF